MTNDQNLRKEARSYFSQEIVPQEIHNRIVDTCRTLQKTPSPAAGFGEKSWLSPPRRWQRPACCCAV